MMPGETKTLGLSLLALSLLGPACSTTPPEIGGMLGTFTGTGSGTTGADSADTSGTGDETGDETGPMFEAVCGDEKIEGDEQCDLGDQNGQGGYCTLDCLENICGDGYVGPGEACDDGNQNDGDLCTSDCGPTTCGDGVINSGEQCDEGDENSETGSCLPSCIEASCGDLFIQDGVEACDGTNTGEATCQTEGFELGVLACTGDCMALDTSNCSACGNGIIENNEICDNDNFQGITCESLGPGDPAMYSDGELNCIDNCMTIDDGACAYCQDGMLEGTVEQCDMEDFGGATCADYGGVGMPNGLLHCTPDCMIDSSQCTFCGDGTIDAPEQCEMMDFGGQTCQSLGLGFDGGDLACTANNCMYDTSGCTTCDGTVLEHGEDCDGADLGTADDCAMELGPNYEGNPCTPTCTLDYSLCCISTGMDGCTGDGDCCSGNCNTMGMPPNTCDPML